MTLNFQNKIVFPAPACSYTSDSAYGQVVYIPRRQKSAEKSLILEDDDSVRRTHSMFVQESETYFRYDARVFNNRSNSSMGLEP